MQDKKRWFVCGTTINLHKHHCIFGNPGRKLSEKYGLTVFLCYEHHEGNHGVHFDRGLNSMLKRRAQQKFEEVHGTREDFMRIFGRNYL